MSFKDDSMSDINTVFCNNTEFFEEHLIDGKNLNILIDEDELMRRKASSDHEKGLHKKQVLFFVAGSEFGPLPAVNRILTLDKKKYLVADAKRIAGMYEILLEVTNG